MSKAASHILYVHGTAGCIARLLRKNVSIQFLNLFTKWWLVSE